ncbi:MAG: S8 family serine peptidase [Planctomycetaceae bacterium]|nr:S8 family serine peptidase [Planctomycetaceae bacterium]
MSLTVRTLSCLLSKLCAVSSGRTRRLRSKSAFLSEPLEVRVLLSASEWGARSVSGDGASVSSNTGTTILNGIDINQFIGVDAFREAGFTGTNAVVANIEGGHIWNGHESLTHVDGFVQDSANPGSQTGDFDRHATWVGMLLAGKSAGVAFNYQEGVVPDARLYSGAIATTWSGESFTTAFNFNSNTFLTPYEDLMSKGVGGDAVTADVINSSWNSNDPTASASGIYSRAIDALVNDTGKTVVFSAGNTGAGPNSVGGPAAGYNVITVGALGNDTDLQPWQSVAGLSSRGFNDLFIPDVSAPANIHDAAQGTILPEVRSVIDIVAPGIGITSALYTGATGGNIGGGDSTPGKADAYTGNLQGSSFAAPLVAGGAALMVDAAKTIFGSSSTAMDGRIIKSILQTSADKIPGWSNRPTLINGIHTTTQSLDEDSGAGRLNLARAKELLLDGTTDLPGDSSGPVQANGWDLGRVSEAAVSDYPIQNVLEAGTPLIATLNWFVDRIITDGGVTTESSFDNLDLELWLTDNGVAARKVAESRSLYNNVEHLSFAVPETGTYLLRVRWSGEIWDLNNDVNTETFGLSWTTTGLVDGGAPVAHATAEDVFLQGPQDQLISVQFLDDTGINTNTILSSAVYVKDASDAVHYLTLQSVDSNQTYDPFVTAVFVMSAPGGTWDSTDDGLYRVFLNDGVVEDELGNTIEGGQIGLFNTQIVQRIGPDSFGYVASPVTFNFEDISETGVPILQGLDDATHLLTDHALGDFSFSFYGATWHELFVSTNGLLTFSSPVASAANTDLSTFSGQSAIAVLWDDLSSYGPNAAVYWQLLGPPGARRLILQWDQVEYLHAGGNITFQVVLDSSDNSIQMNYLDLDGGDAGHNEGLSATAGLRSGDPLSTTLLSSFNGSSSVFVASHRSVRFYDPRPVAPSITTPGTYDLRTFTPEFRWSESQGTEQYEIWVNRLTGETARVIHAFVGETIFTPSQPMAMGLYRVWVRAISAQNDRSSWSTPFTFRINAPAEITPLQRLQKTARPLIEWEVVPGASTYEIWINNLSNHASAVVYKSGLTSTTFEPEQDLPFGQYRVWVRATDEGQRPGAWSDPVDFVAAYWPTLTAPSAVVTFNHRPQFEWTVLDGAASSQIFVRNTFTKEVILNQPVSANGVWTSTVDLPRGEYDWWVRGVTLDGIAGWWSYAARFSVAGSPVLTMPAGTVPSTPLFSWKPVELAQHYTLVIHSMGGGHDSITLNNLSGTQHSTTTLASGVWRVWVRAVSGTGELSWWSRPVDFTVE